MSSDLESSIVRREPLVTDGKSGSQLERVWLEDGSVVVLKHSSIDQDWIMQATADDGRTALLWDEGIFDRVRPVVEHAVLDVQRSQIADLVVMEDVSASLFSKGTQLRRGHDLVLSALAEIHQIFAGTPLPPLCPLGSLYAFLSPQVCAQFAASHDVPRLAVEGWDRFHEIVPSDISSLVAAIHTHPESLAEDLSHRDSTLIHGDPKLANLGMIIDTRRTVLIDWGTLTAFGPPAIDFAWYIAINGAAIGLPHDRLLSDARNWLAPVDEDALKLALLGALVQLGWEKALGATADEPAIRAREGDGLTWWIDRAREAADVWSG